MGNLFTYRALRGLIRVTDPTSGSTPAGSHRIVLRLTRDLTYAVATLALVASLFRTTVPPWLIVALAAGELLFIRLQDRAMRHGTLPRWAPPSHIVTSLLLLTLGIAYSGGIQSSFVWVYGLSMAVEGIVRGRSWALASALLSSAYLFLATVAVRAGMFPYASERWPAAMAAAFCVSYVGMFFTVALTTALLGERLRGQYAEIAGLADRLRDSYLGTVRALGSAVEVKDAYTREHADRVERRAVAVARALGIPHDEVESTRLASILHDIGKIGVPDQILRKPGPLTPGEWTVMRGHPLQGAAILAEVPFLKSVAAIVRSHHERLDGRGYPDGLAGDRIPLASRIIAVVDAYEAMTTDRPYRLALGHGEAAAELRANAGTQFDPRVVETFLRLTEMEAQTRMPGLLRVPVSAAPASP